MGRLVAGVAPARAAVGLLALALVPGPRGAIEGLERDRDPGVHAGPEGHRGELGAGVVSRERPVARFLHRAAARRHRGGPVRPLAVETLIVDQELGAVGDAVPVFRGIEPLQHHRMERHGIGALELRRERVLQQLLEERVVLRDAGVEQGPEHQVVRRRRGAVAGRRQLGVAQVVDPLREGRLDLRGEDDRGGRLRRPRRRDLRRRDGTSEDDVEGQEDQRRRREREEGAQRRASPGQVVDDARDHRILLGAGPKRRLDLGGQIRGRLPFGPRQEAGHRDLVQQAAAERLRRLEQLAGLVVRQRPVEVLLDQDLEAFLGHAPSSALATDGRGAPSPMHLRSVSRTRKSVVATQVADCPRRAAISSTLRSS